MANPNAVINWTPEQARENGKRGIRIRWDRVKAKAEALAKTGQTVNVANAQETISTLTTEFVRLMVSRAVSWSNGDRFEQCAKALRILGQAAPTQQTVPKSHKTPRPKPPKSQSPAVQVQAQLAPDPPDNPT